jgi:osmoprotectant transport system substrate-binding protein
MRKRARAALLGAVATGLVAIGGCGSSTSPKATSQGAGSPAGAGRPGAGKPPVTLGTKNFTEQYILGELYAQALRAKGYRVRLVRDIGPSEVIARAVTSDRIDGYPEYTGTILSAVGHETARARSARDAYARAAAFEQKRGVALLAMAAAEDTDALAVKASYARRRRLRAVPDLRRLGPDVALGGAVEFKTRPYGLPGLRRTYSIANLRFRPLVIGTQYQALDRGRVQVAAVFTTDGQLSEGGYTVLEDPQKLFGYQNVTFAIRRSVLDREGPAFAQTVNAVSAKLSTQALRVMNASVVLDQQAPQAVARQFLRANGLG